MPSLTAIAPSLDPGAPEHVAFDAFRARNESLRDCMVFHLTDRGFFAELSDVARAMVYAWQNDLQLLLDSTRFAYRIERGWEDYFEPFCRSAHEVDPRRVRERFAFHPRKRDETPVRRLQLFTTRQLRIGRLRLTGFPAILDFFQRMIFRLNAECRREVARLIDGLSLPESYPALHIRRGDKIGDEDVHYPAGLYLSRLGEIPDRACIFAMSDDYGAVEDVRRTLSTRCVNARVASLCTPEATGFDVNKLRRTEAFMSAADSRSDRVDRRYLQRATIRLLADTIVASRAARVVSTQRSFVGKALKALSRAPENVELLRADDVSSYVVSKLPAGRHVLDAYEKVFLIRIGHHGAGFFAYVQYALNQIQHCERHGYLPVVHYDGDHANHFHDPAVGDDVWGYYFEPVAGYTKADVDAMLADERDRLTPEDVVRLSDDEILRLCQFDPRSIFHYTYGYWREHPPDDPEAWYASMRRKGHRYVSEYVRIKQPILAEAEAFVGRHMRGHRVLGVHIRGTDMRYAPPVPLQRFCDEIDRRLRKEFDLVFVATDQHQYVQRLRTRYGDRLIHQDCLRSTDARNPMWLERRSPAAQGKEVLLDALLLSRCQFMLKSPSAVSEFAHYFRPSLQSLDLNEHRTEFAGRDYTKPGLGYGGYPKAWDAVGGDEPKERNRPSRDRWVEPIVQRK